MNVLKRAFAIMLCFALALLVSCSGGKSNQGERTSDDPLAPIQANQQQPTIKVEAHELFVSYGKDVIAADKRYTGQLVELASVSGKVQKDRAGRYYLVAAEQARIVKSEDQGGQITSVTEFQRRVLEDALNTKYMPGIVLYLDTKQADDLPDWARKK